MLRHGWLLLGLFLSVLFASGAWAGEATDQVNDPGTGLSFGPGAGPASMFQSFTPAVTPICAVELRLRAGGDFAGPYNTTMRLRDGTVGGTILTAVTSTIPSATLGEQPLVRFDFPGPVAVVPGQTYVIEWLAPGDTILTWMGVDYNSYAGGSSLATDGGEIANQDYNFITYRPQIVQWSSAVGGNDHYYEYVLGYKTWTAANTAAQARSHLGVGGHLATIASAAENSFIRSLKGNGDMRGWIGLTDTATEGVYEWVTGEPFSYANWYPGEPNDYAGDEDYVEFFGNGQWNDNRNDSNDYNLGYVVEYDYVPNTTPSFEEPTLFASGSSFEWASGKLLTFPVRAVDPDTGELLDLTISGQPPNATFSEITDGPSPAESTFSWTPTDAQGQLGDSFTIIFTVTDSVGAQATFMFTVTPSYDQDGDGLLDAWEEQGGGYTHDNGVHVDLYSMGARKDVQDIFVQIDYVKYGAFDHRPIDAAIQAIKDSFLDHGIVLHVMIDEELPSALSPEFLGEEVGGAYLWTGGTAGVTYFDDIKAAHFPEELSWAVRYCVFAHKLPIGDLTTSGIAREGGSDFIVALGAYANGVGSPDQQSGTFMHELGHLLGLRHGGDDDVKHKPNYLSVMNYSFQMTGLITSTHRKFDYSPMLLPALNENALSETAGLGSDATGYGTKWYSKNAPVGNPFRSQADATHDIDWNDANGVESGTVWADINKDLLPVILNGSVVVAAPADLTGYNDWMHIDFTGGAIGAGVSLPPPPKTEAPDEVTLETVQQFQGPPPAKVKAHTPESGMVTLTWKPSGPKNAGFTYNVFRVGGGSSGFLGSTANSNFHDKTVVAGTTYTYSVSVVDPVNGESTTADVEVTAR